MYSHQVLELHAQQKKLQPKSGTVAELGSGAYISNLKLQHQRVRLGELQPVLRRYNFVLEDLSGDDKDDCNQDAMFPPKYKVRTSFSCLDKNALRGAFPAPVGTEAAARGALELAADAPIMGYYEVLLPLPKDPAQRRLSKKETFSRFSYTDWRLSNAASAKPGTTLDIGSLTEWIAEAEVCTFEGYILHTFYSESRRVNSPKKMMILFVKIAAADSG